MQQSEDANKTVDGVRRIVVQDNSIAPPADGRGRRLQDPPQSKIAIRHSTESRWKLPSIRASYLAPGLAGIIALLMLFGWLAMRNSSAGRRVGGSGSSEAQTRTPSPLEVSSPGVSPTQSEGLLRTEEDAKQVLRRISRDNKPYSFSENAVKNIHSRVLELSRSANVSDSLLKLQAQSVAISSKSRKEGLQPSLVILLALALTKGGESGDCLNAAAGALPLLASLNKTFGSSEADSSLILIAAFREGPGTRRSHPLLRRMNRVVNNPLTERNVWYLNDHKVLTTGAYELVIDTIAYGVIARNPRQFGLDNDPLSL